MSADLCRAVRRAAIQGRVRAEGLLFGGVPLEVKGPGLEFVDYREYVYGDDIRRVDWRVSARAGRNLEKLFVRVYRSERRVKVIYVVDLTSSLGFKDKLEALAFTVGLHARISAALEDIVGLITVTHEARFHGFMEPELLVSRLLRMICRDGAAGSLDISSAARLVSKVAGKSPVFLYTDYANKVASYRRLNLLARAMGAPLYAYIFATPGETGKAHVEGLTSLLDFESGNALTVSLGEYAALVRSHVASVKASLGFSRVFEVESLKQAMAYVPSLAVSYIRARGRY